MADGWKWANGPFGSLESLQMLAARIRRDVVEMIGGDGATGHLGGSCSCADILAALYGAKMRHRPSEPDYPGRDKFICSKGHAAIALYAALAETGYFPREELRSVKQLGSMLQGHPDRLKTPGVEAGTGSLGQGLSIANGLALAMRLDGSDRKVYCLMGDGEIAEGQIWEAAMASSNFRLDSLTAILDQNGLQATGPCAERFRTDPLPEKWRSFGWHVIRADGHDIRAVLEALDEADATKGAPSIVIAATVKGKGISFAENVAAFHNGSLTKEQYGAALGELDGRLGELMAAGARGR
ncbi:MAG: transketolase [Clostridiales bacterium]|jgi:transketolase|nr:transketolase [Clostridiales bacterium]